jgi:aspartyl-tRNA(Asn)/glutamyl-tRNA(Gln) amidotransferase subunit C
MVIDLPSEARAAKLRLADRMLRFLVPEPSTAERFTAKDVERLARLARLALTPDEIALFTRQLADFLAYAQQVQQLDTSGIAPTSHAVGAPTELREDRPVPCLPRDLALSQAPEAARGAGLFKVPRVIG